MDALFVILTLSVLINILLLRWGVYEHRSRRQWQQEAIILQRALRDGNLSARAPVWGMGFWMLLGFVLIVGLIAALA